MPNHTCLIKNVDWVITVDAERRMIEDGAIAISGDRIEAVDKSVAVEARFQTGKIIDGRGLIAIPGLIDANVSTVHQLGRGAADFCDLPKFMLERILPYEASLSIDDAIVASRLCQLEMIRSGTTCFLDSGSLTPDAVAGVAVETGLRAIVPRACFDFFETFLGAFPIAWPQETTNEAVEHAVAAVERIRHLGNSRITPALSLPWLAAASDTLIREVGALRHSTQVPVTVGAGRSRDEAVAARRQYRCTEIDRLLHAGILGHAAIIAHAGWTSPDDLAHVATTGAHIACCPSASQRLGTGALELGRFPELLAFGANVCLGSGSAMASNYVDVARQLSLFAGSSKSYRLDATIITPEAALEMATVRGAAALGLSDEIGTLAVGKKADITLFNMASADWAPVINPIANLVFSSRGGAHTVIVDGKIVMSAGAMGTLDEEMVLSEGQRLADELAERNGLIRFCKPRWPVT